MDIRIAVDSRELLFKICLANRLWQFNHFAANAHAAHLLDGTTLIRQIIRSRADPHDAKLRDNSLLGKLLHFTQQFFLHRSNHFGTFHDDAHLITASIFLCLSCQPSQFLPSTRRSRSCRHARRTEPSAHTYDKRTLRNAKKNLSDHGQIHCSQRSSTSPPLVLVSALRLPYFVLVATSLASPNPRPVQSPRASAVPKCNILGTDPKCNRLGERGFPATTKITVACTLPCNTFVLHTKADEATDNGDTISIDGLERSS